MLTLQTMTLEVIIIAPDSACAYPAGHHALAAVLYRVAIDIKIIYVPRTFKSEMSVAEAFTAEVGKIRAGRNRVRDSAFHERRHNSRPSFIGAAGYVADTE